MRSLAASADGGVGGAPAKGVTRGQVAIHCSLVEDIGYGADSGSGPAMSIGGAASVVPRVIPAAIDTALALKGQVEPIPRPIVCGELGATRCFRILLGDIVVDG
jgi:hypothetical protein